jgi:hypothetical protein
MEAIQLAYGKSVVLLRYPFVSEIVHGGAPEVFLHQSKLERRDMTYTVPK